MSESELTNRVSVHEYDRSKGCKNKTPSEIGGQS